MVEVSLDEHHDFFTGFMNEVGASVLSKQHLELKGTFLLLGTSVQTLLLAQGQGVNSTTSTDILLMRGSFLITSLKLSSDRFFSNF